MRYSFLAATLGATAVSAFPFVLESKGVDPNVLGSHALSTRQQSGGSNPGGPLTCPYTPWEDHIPAVGITDEFPYNGAKNGKQGNGHGGYKVPADGDEAHKFIAPGPGDIRGPCPGLNVAANHGFLARDGITTFDELVDAQQNLYNVGYDLALILAFLGLTITDGNIQTERLSIGCDASNRTSLGAFTLGTPIEPGLDGHNKFEADTSLTRNDYFLGKGDNFNMNTTLFKMMTETTGGNYNRDNLAKYRYQRFQQSKADNPNFYFGPFSLLLFGASSFLYELMASGPGIQPDEPTISSFFGVKKGSDGEYVFTGEEKIPDNWYNRVDPYTSEGVVTEIVAQYLEYPVLFGGNTGGGTYDLIPDFGYIKDGKLSLPEVDNVACLIYQLVGERVPSGLNTVFAPTLDALNFITSKLSPGLQNLGCPSPLT